MLHNPAGRENPFSTDYPSIPCSFSAAVKRIEFVPLHGNNFKIPEREMLKALSSSPSLASSLAARAGSFGFSYREVRCSRHANGPTDRVNIRSLQKRVPARTANACRHARARNMDLSCDV